MAWLPTAAQVRSYPDKASAKVLRIEKGRPDPALIIAGFSAETESPLFNSAKTFKAYAPCVLSRMGDSICGQRLYFTDIKNSETFMITGEVDLAERTRPISDLKWLDNHRLSYERWMNPHFGRRYIVNVKLRRQTAAFVITDSR